MKILNANLYKQFRFAAAILAVGSFTVVGSVHAGDHVNFKGDIAGSTVEDDPELPGFGIAVLSGNLSHLGKTTVVTLTESSTFHFYCDPDVNAPCFDGELLGLPPGTGLVSFGSGENGEPLALARVQQFVTFTAANGDELWAEQVGFGFFDLFGGFFPNFEIVAEIVGGTGRFENATGSYTASGIQVLVDGDNNDLFEASINGTISTVGSRRGKRNR